MLIPCLSRLALACSVVNGADIVIFCVRLCSLNTNYACKRVHVKGKCVQTYSLGDRLRKERERLKLSQDEMGQVGGVNRNTQGKYEKGDRNPDSAYLSALANVGVDVLYVLTGQRLSTSETSLSSEEVELLNSYRGMTALSRDSFRHIALTVAKVDGTSSNENY
ncbi:helix-turn-helix transcriptional regulator [Pseudomonas sp.]|uniref:helix-turn-helix domain-containing protein n=1 Tax=Pseudomonas sp. TaxID=306 RepID=UPI00289C2066|nr:helix-turn-helix transcriptional regulator [Pseudomonas sp.]